jgi:transcriptional regulator with XRE-family HTH domain
MQKNLSEKVHSKIGVNIKKFSKRNGLSKSELVRRTGLDYHTIAKIERGVTPDPRVHTVVKIASALGITVEELVK